MNAEGTNDESIPQQDGLPFLDEREVSIEFRVEALSRLYPWVIANRDSGTKFRDCWVRPGAYDPETGQIVELENEYHRIRVCGVDCLAHVAMLILTHNRFPRRYVDSSLDEIGLHLCNNPACFNPVHLKFGTHSENMKYMHATGRAAQSSIQRTATGEIVPRKLRDRLTTEHWRMALQLLKKYGLERGASPSIAQHLGVSRYAIENLKRSKRHLSPDVEETEVEIEMIRWKHGRRPARANYAEQKAMAREIRERFHAAAIHERVPLVKALASEFHCSERWIRMILNRDAIPDVAPEIPIPDNFGLGTRHYKGKFNPPSSDE